MIATEIYNGQGLGNQLWCYVFTRCLSQKLGTDFSILSPEKLKCTSFLNLDYGQFIMNDGLTPEGGPPVKLPSILKHYYKEHQKFHYLSGADITYFDPEVLKIGDYTKIDGNFQSVEFISKFRSEITEWLKVDESINCEEFSDENTCIINFRGGEYKGRKDLFLNEDYWKNAIKQMESINPNLRFVVITDDVYEASKFFPNFKVLHFSIGKDYSIINNAYYLIVSNSSFAFFPAWTSKKLKYCLAPKYWAAYNQSAGYWSCQYNIVPDWNYIDNAGNVIKGEQCLLEQKNHTIDDLYYSDKRAEISFYLKLKLKIQEVKKGIAIKITTAYKRVAVYFYNKIGSFNTNLDIYLNNSLKFYRPNNRRKENGTKVYDCIHFFNELDLLEIRLNILDKYVDFFVIAEATVTFSGEAKPLYYQENKSRYQKFNHKIIHYVIDDTPNSIDELIERQYTESERLKKEIISLTLTTDNFKKDQVHWLREFYQKESIRIPIDKIDRNEICIVSDVDEIWRPELIAIPLGKELIIYKQKAFFYYLNNYTNDFWWTGWTGSVSFRRSLLTNGSINHLRTHHKNKYLVVADGGWHFTFQGGKEKIIKKLESYGHQEFNTSSIKKSIEKFEKFDSDYRGRSLKFKITDLYYPKYISENLKKYDHMILK